jgi:hypothetical protein
MRVNGGACCSVRTGGAGLFKSSPSFILSLFDRVVFLSRRKERKKHPREDASKKRLSLCVCLECSRNLVFSCLISDERLPSRCVLYRRC